MFSVSEYLSRIERAYLDILEGLKPVSKTITLWLGLDGLRLNEDGTMEWVSRKKKPTETVFCQPCQSIQTCADQTQSTRAQIEVLMAQMEQNMVLQMQSRQSAQITNAIQQCCIQYPAQYPPYYYGGCCGNYIG